MPPPHIGDNNKNRVENIKKKFEGTNKFVPVTDNLNNVAAKCRSGRLEDDSNGNTDSRCQTDAPKKQKLALTTDISAPNAGGHFLNNQTPSKGHPTLERQLSSPTSRGHIKRSPAFRCDRIVRGKNVLAPSPGAPRSVVGKRVKQFDSTPDLVSAKICNVIGDEQPQQLQVKLSLDGVNDRARAFTSPDNFSQSPKIPLDSNSSGPCEAKRNRLDILGGTTGAKNGFSVNSTGSWVHSRHDIGKPGSVSEILKDNNKIKTPFSNQESFPGKNLLSEIKLKRTVNSFNDNSYHEEKAGTSLKNHINQAGPAPKALSPSVIPSNGSSQTYQQGLSATLKEALKAPLPCGPPPKKPPRTFAHNSPKVKSPSERINNLKSNPGAIKTPEVSCHISVSPPPVIKPTRSKTESQIMLRKLEDALMNHKSSPRGAQSPTSPADKSIRQGSLSPPGNSATSGYPGGMNSQNKICTPTHAARSGCLSSLNCAVGPTLCSQPRDSAQEVQAKQPEFTPGPHTKRKSSLQDNTSNVRKIIPGSLHKSHSVEHIYAEPFQFIGDGNQICKSKDCEANFRTSSFGKEIPKPQPRFQPKRILSTSPEQIFRTRLGSPTETNSEGLHYLVKILLCDKLEYVILTFMC